ncbi:MAG: glucose-6-phosphate isomerase [Syntrophomonadaceae bacterium]|nr:glucose-6-phosphate isomerase [Syntrophomonadaceae bacterium]
MTDLLTVDIGHLFTERGGVSRAELEWMMVENQGKFEDFRRSLGQERFPLTVSFTERGEIPRIKALAREIRVKFANVLLVGIGGSSLGARAAGLFMRGPYYNLTNEPRMFFLDNLDPALVDGLEKVLDLRETALIYISKSGSTAESAANFMYFFDKYREAGGDPRDVVFICDRLDNGVNRIARELGCNLLHTPLELGGRFSVLSCVGFLPAEIMGIDCEELLEGAMVVYRMIHEGVPEENGVLALGSCLFALGAGRPIHVLFNYGSLLYDFGLWFMQLWAESLGKKHSLSGDVVHAGTTPLNALGATDQHSLLQLFKEGPADKVFGFVKVNRAPSDIVIPDVFPGEDEYAYFAGRTMNQQLHIQQLATEISLFQEGHPCYRITARDYSAMTLGALFYFYQALTVFCGSLWRVNPFDQPGVEDSKKMTYALMGRKSFLDCRGDYEAVVADYEKGSLSFGFR